MRQTGINGFGPLSWGTHACLFYRTLDDLFQIVAPFIIQGLKSNECCLWITPEPVSVDSAVAAMKKTGFDPHPHVESGQMMIIGTADFHGESPDTDAVTARLRETVEESIKNGFAGLRVAGEPPRSADAGRQVSMDCDTAIDRMIDGQSMIALHMFPLDSSNTIEVAHRVSAHEYTLVKDRDTFEVIENAGCSRVKGILQDAAEKELAEKELNRREKELTAIYENAPMIMLLLDTKQCVRKANKATLDGNDGRQGCIVGQRAGESLRCINALNESDGCGLSPYCNTCIVRNNILDTLRTGQQHFRSEATMRLDLSDGPQNVYLWVSTIPIELEEPMVLVCIEDVTDLKRAMEGIREREARLRSLFLSAPIGIGFLTVIEENGIVTDRIIREANAHFCQMLGYSRDALVGHSVRSLYATPGDFTHTGSILYSQMQSRKIGSIETRWKKSNGEVIDILLNTAPVNPFDWDDGFSFAALDITAAKTAETERKKLEDQLRQSQKMEAIGQLAGGIAHDFNNLLQIINGYADLMLDSIEPLHPTRSNLEEIIKAGKKAGNLIRQLLAFSRRQIIRLEDVFLNDLIQNLLKMIQRIIGENIELDFIPGHSLGLVRADPGQMEQVLLNLCVNARDAMPEGGKLTLETQNVLINGKYCETHSWAKPGRFVLISVTDTGAGMDEKTKSHIFEPFYTTKDLNKGTGLGLSTVYGIVRQHGGMIMVYSEIDNGTMFKIYLPMVERRAVEVGAAIQKRTRGGEETILIAEDDEMVRNLMKTILERAGYAVLTAEEGEAAVRRFKADADRIDMAILDVIMPKLSGREVHDMIKAIKPSVKVLFSSGYSTNAIHTNFVLHNGMRLIQKPFASDELLQRVREVLDEKDATHHT